MHGTVCVGSDFWWSPNLTSIQHRHSPKGTAGCSELHPAGFLVFPRMETAVSLGAPVPACDHPNAHKLSPSSPQEIPLLLPVFTASCIFAVLLREELELLTWCIFMFSYH